MSSGVLEEYVVESLVLCFAVFPVVSMCATYTVPSAQRGCLAELNKQHESPHSDITMKVQSLPSRLWFISASVANGARDQTQ